MYWDENFLAPVVASDGSVWLRIMHLGEPTVPDWKSGDLCDGLARFDGATWSTYLPDTCIIDIAPGPDGSVWVSAAPAGQGGTHPGNPLYIIRP